MKTKILLLLVSLVIMNACFSQNIKDEIFMVFDARAKYIRDSIPEKFKFHYNPFIELNHSLIIDSILSCISKEDISNTVIYISEFIPDDYRSKLVGVIWNDHKVISYEWNEITGQIELHQGKFLVMVKPFVSDIEEWNENITNRSYCWTSIAGAWYGFCSKILVENDSMYIENDVFRLYDKNYSEIYLKEKRANDYVNESIANPNVHANIEL